MSEDTAYDDCMKAGQEGGSRFIGPAGAHPPWSIKAY